MAARRTGKARPKATARPRANHGGSRAGSGRKPQEITELRREFDRLAHDLIAEHLPQLIGNLVRLANGGYERVELEYATDERGFEVLAKRKVETADADREANKYLIDRILGRPRQAVEMSGPEGQPVPVSFEKAVERVYGSDDDGTTTTTGDDG